MAERQWCVYSTRDFHAACHNMASRKTLSHSLGETMVTAQMSRSSARLRKMWASVEMKYAPRTYPPRRRVPHRPRSSQAFRCRAFAALVFEFLEQLAHGHSLRATAAIVTKPGIVKVQVWGFGHANISTTRITITVESGQRIVQRLRLRI